MSTRPYRPNKAPGLVPYLTSPNPETLRDFLCQAFRFEQDGSPIAVDGRVAHLEMVNPDTRIMIGLEGAWGSKDLSPVSMNAGEQGIGLYVYVEDVDEHFKTASKAGASISVELNDAFWGDRMYATTDIDGNCWTFATNKGDFDPNKAPK